MGRRLPERKRGRPSGTGRYALLAGGWLVSWPSGSGISRTPTSRFPTSGRSRRRIRRRRPSWSWREAGPGPATGASSGGSAPADLSPTGTMRSESRRVDFNQLQGRLKPTGRGVGAAEAPLLGSSRKICISHPRRSLRKLLELILARRLGSADQGAHTRAVSERDQWGDGLWR